MKQRSSNKMRAFLLIAIGVVLIALGIGAYKFPVSLKQSLTQKKDMGLVTEISNFENLTLEDLPNFTDVRMVAPYKDRKIVMGFGLILDVDATGKMYRINAPELDCVYSTAVIGASLYASCNDNITWPSENVMAKTKGTIFKINLDTGKIDERIDEETLIGHTFVNLTLVSKNDDLWGSGNDGVFRYNTKTKEVSYFPANEVIWGEPQPARPGGCGGIGRIILDKGIPVVFSQNCDMKSAYNESKSSWEVAKSVDELPQHLNLQLADFGLDLPFFEAISPVQSEKRYLFANNGVYELKKGGLPMRVFEGSLKGSFNDEAYVDADERYALIAGVMGYGERMKAPLLYEEMSIVLVDLQQHQVYDLMSAFPDRNTTQSSYGYVSDGLLEKIQFVQEGPLIHVLSEDGKETLLSVDTEKKMLLMTKSK